MDRLTCVRMFVAVMEQGSFTAAAQRLGTSSGQASKLVARLEEELGVQLLARTTRALSPTSAGRSYYEGIRSLLDEFEALDASVRSASAVPQGRLRISVPITFGARVLSPLLRDFAVANPGISLDVDFSDRLANLVDDGFDLALRIGAPRDSSLVSRRLCQIRLLTVAAPGYLARHPTPAVPADLAAHDCVLDGNFRTPQTWVFRDPLTGREEGQAVQGRLCLANAEAVAEAAVAGLGIAQGPSFVMGPLIGAGRLVPLLGAHEVTPLPLMVLYPAARHLPTKLRAIVDFLAEHFRGPQDWSRIPE